MEIGIVFSNSAAHRHLRFLLLCSLRRSSCLPFAGVRSRRRAVSRVAAIIQASSGHAGHCPRSRRHSDASSAQLQPSLMMRPPSTGSKGCPPSFLFWLCRPRSRHSTPASSANPRPSSQPTKLFRGRRRGLDFENSNNHRVKYVNVLLTYTWAQDLNVIT